MSTRSVSSPYGKRNLLTLTYKDHPSIKSLVEYVLSKANSSPPLRTVLEDALAPTSRTHVGLILSERLVNMPVQVVPPMYRMLADETKWAVDEVPSSSTNFILTHVRSGRTFHLQILPHLNTHLPSFSWGAATLGTNFQRLKAQKGPSECN